MKMNQMEHKDYFSIRKYKYAAVRKLTTRTFKGQLFDKELNSSMSQRNVEKKTTPKKVFA